MPWVQIAKRKINTARICFIEDDGAGGLKAHFSGMEHPLALQTEEARALWKHIKCDDALAGKQGHHQVLQKKTTAGDVFDVKADDHHAREKPAPPQAQRR